MEWPGQLVAFHVSVPLDDVCLSATDLPHQGQLFFVNGNVGIGPLFLVYFLHMVSHVALAVVCIVAGGTMVWFQFAMHEKVVQKLHPAVEHFWTVDAF